MANDITLSTHAVRQPLLDALRALALLAVLVVNAAGYLAAPWGPLLGERSPPDGLPGSSLAWAVQALQAALLQAKGYPALAFLFGMGLWLAQRGRAAPLAHQRGVARQKRLLVLGVVHGALVYFGDILTMYALVGWHVLARVREPWRSLRVRLRHAFVWALGVTLLSALATVWLGTVAAFDGAAGAAAEPTLANALGWAGFVGVNAGAYAVLQLAALLLFWPVLRLCMLGGIAAARLRLLTHRRWRAPIKRGLARVALPLLLLNLSYGVLYASTTHSSQRALWIELVGSLVSLPLAAVYVAALSLAARGGWAPWCGVLAPLGQRTLSLYLGYSVLCLALFSGVGLGWQPGTAGMFGFAVATWAAALLAARASGSTRWPMEALLAAVVRR